MVDNEEIRPHVDRAVPYERTALDGTSWVDIARGWMVDGDGLCERLLEDVRWGASKVFRYDHFVEQRRLGSGWVPGQPMPHPALAEATRVLQHHYGVTFGGFTLMQYRDGSDGQGFHRDTDMRWLDDTLIAVLSLGAQRPWLVRSASARGNRDAEMGELSRSDIDLSPASGDLLVLGGRAQADWLHSVAYQPGSKLGPRVSIQWRFVRKTGRPQIGPGFSAQRNYGRPRNRAR